MQAGGGLVSWHLLERNFWGFCGYQKIINSPTFFAMLGVRAELGRVFGDEDRVPGFAEAVILSDGIWRRLFGGDPNILGRKLRLDNDLYSVAGVLPPGFRHPGLPAQSPVDIWITTGFSGTPF